VEQTATAALAILDELATPEQERKYDRFFPPGERDPDIRFVGVPMGQVFALARSFLDLAESELEALLDQPVHEGRVLAVKVLALRARRGSEAERTWAYEFFLRRHDRIDTWDLVDLGAPDTVGRYLLDHPRDILDELAASSDPWRRRSALYATVPLIRAGQLDDAFRIAERLIDDPHEYVQKAVGTILRTAGDGDPGRLHEILDRHAATKPRPALRMANEKLDRAERDARLARGTAR
jgi:3-methyladenine DNA glycosylase AlkD